MGNITHFTYDDLFSLPSIHFNNKRAKKKKRNKNTIKRRFKAQHQKSKSNGHFFNIFVDSFIVSLIFYTPFFSIVANGQCVENPLPNVCLNNWLLNTFEILIEHNIGKCMNVSWPEMVCVCALSPCRSAAYIVHHFCFVAFHNVSIKFEFDNTSKYTKHFTCYSKW